MQGEFAGGVGGDDGGEALFRDVEDDFGKKAVYGDFGDGAVELIASADLGEGTGGIVAHALQVWRKLGGVDAMVSAGGFDCGELAAQDPLLDGGVADADGGGGFAG